MGMYTELVLGFQTKNPELIELIQHMLNGKTPKYNDRRDWFLNCSSCYFPCTMSHSAIEKDDCSDWWNCSIRCSLKNYEQEIQWFLGELLQKLEEKDGKLLGYYRYEEDQDPTLVWATDDGKKQDYD